MIFYFNSDGKLINSVPSNVYQGSNKASRIYFVCPTAKSNVISVAFTLPSGLYSSKRMLTRTELTGDGMGLSSGNGKVVNEEDVGFNVWQYDIPFSVTEYAGQVTVQFFIDDNTGTTVATQSVTFLVEKGSGVVPPNISDDEYQEIVETITGYYQSTADEMRALDTRLSQEIAEKQDALVSGVNIKTINGQPILGAGNINIEGGGSGGTIVVDGELSDTSTNPVENQVIYNALQKKQNKYLLFTTDGFGSEGTFYDENGQQITDLTNYVGKQINAQFSSMDKLLSLSDYTEKYFIFRTQSDALANNEYLVMPVSKIGTGDYICVSGTANVNRFCVQVGSTIIFEADAPVVDNALSDTSTNPVENRVVYQTKQELLSAINTKPIVHVISCFDNFSSSGTFKDSVGNIITPNTGNYIQQNLRNYQFNSQDTAITILGRETEYIITRVADSESASSANGYYFLVLTVNEFAQETNKIIQIVEDDVPDRWASYGKTCYEVKGGLNDYSRYGEFTVSNISWSQIENIEPYTYETSFPITDVLTQQEIKDKNCVFTLFNDNAVLFAKYGFSVYSVTSNFENLLAPVIATVISIGAPTEDITFSFKGEVIE